MWMNISGYVMLAGTKGSFRDVATQVGRYEMRETLRPTQVFNFFLKEK
jgi:hypothetical protein